MLSYEQISQLARANVRVNATRAAIQVQAACAEHLPPRDYLLELLAKRNRECEQVYAQVYGAAYRRKIT